MKDKFKLVAAFLCGAVFFSGISYAATNLTATVSNLKIIVNGEEKTLAEKPVVINNRTYLPVRDIGDVTGYNVDYKSGVVSLNNTDQNSTNGANSISDDNSESPKFEFKKLPITVTSDDISVTVNSVTLGEYSTDFNVTIQNNSDKDAQVRYDSNGMGANWNVEGKEYQTYGTIAEKNEFSNPVKAGESVTGTIKKSKVDTGTENLLFHLMINGKGFSFYIDTKEIF